MYSSLSKHTLHRLDLSLYLRLHHAFQHVSSSKKNTLHFLRRVSVSSNHIGMSLLKRVARSCFTTHDTNLGNLNADSQLCEQMLQIEELHSDFTAYDDQSPSPPATAAATPSDCAEEGSDSADCEKASSESAEYGWLRTGMERLSHSFRLIFAERDDESPSATALTVVSTRDEIDTRADAFIAGFREQMRLERTESDMRYFEMLARSLT